MSNTTVSQPEPYAGRELQPVNALTGPAAAIFTELHGGDDGATVAALALAAGISRSTASKALGTLEKAGLASRTPGGNDRTRRLPDVWRLAAPGTGKAPEGTAEADVDGAQADWEPIDAQHSPEAPSEAEVEQPAVDTSDAAGSDLTDGDRPSTIGVDRITSDNGADDEDGLAATDAAAATPAPEPASDGPTVPPGQACPTCGHRRRLAVPKAATGGGPRLGQGQLHQMALDHLRSYPDEDWTATGIANVIGRSSGAIANALVTMVSRGEAEQTRDKPRRYRATSSATVD